MFSQQLLRMINDLLDITRMESGEMLLHPRSLDTEVTAGEVIAAVQALARMKSITTSATVTPGLPPAWADGEMLHRVLINLVGNALKFTPTGGEVSLIIGPGPAGFLKLSVLDTGPGIPDGFQDIIFEKIGQVENGGEQDNLSSGLGLTFCKMAVEAHRGQIWVEPLPDCGCSFSVLWPTAQTS